MEREKLSSTGIGDELAIYIVDLLTLSTQWLFLHLSAKEKHYWDSIDERV